MSAEIIFDDSTPEEFRPLFLGTARDVIKKAIEMIESESLEEQKRILSDPIFCIAVIGALDNLDQRRHQAANDFVSRFQTELQPQASETFIGESKLIFRLDTKMNK
jgi:hypothetical protein